MSHGIYVNWPTKMVTLHKSSCRHYKNRKSNTPNGEWHPFSGTKAKAVSKQNKIARLAQTRECKDCKP